MQPSLTYLEERLLFPTRSARFASARRMRLAQSYAIWGQVTAAVALVGWSLAPAFFAGLRENPSLPFFTVVMSVYVMATALVQQFASYIDRARSLESSARRIDALRRSVQASIMEGKDRDADAFRDFSEKYAEVLEENPINHHQFDALHASAPGGTGKWWLFTVGLHIIAGLPMILSILVVFLPFYFA